MTRFTFRKVKKNLKFHHIQDPFPSIKKIMEIESVVASDDIYNNYNVSTIDGEGRVREVTVSEMTDVRGFPTKRVQQLLHAGIFDGDFLWLSITGDKGGAEFKLCFSIGNVPNLT
uniref:Uncharacterized protein n=1 Tax=Caenorhabditis japonica TaxID=281687 RepID=A0A8R1E8K8_CAEJA